MSSIAEFFRATFFRDNFLRFTPRTSLVFMGFIHINHHNDLITFGGPHMSHGDGSPGI